MTAPKNHLSIVSETLARYEILDSPPEAAFDDIARRAAEILRAPMSGISFFRPTGDDGNGGDGKGPPPPEWSERSEWTEWSEWSEWFKARHHLPFTKLAASARFFLVPPSISKRSQYATIVPDALADKRLRDHVLVSGPPYLCFYAGTGIFSRNDELVGVLSVFDTVARDVNSSDKEALMNLAALVGARCEARAEARRERRLHIVPAVTRSIDDAVAASAVAVGNTGISGLLAAEQHVDHLTAEFVRLEQLLEDEIQIRQSTEDKLRVEKEFSDAAIQSLPGSFYMFDQNGRMVRWNTSFMTNTGYSQEEIAEMRALDFISDVDRANVADAIRKIFEHGGDISLEAKMCHRNGGTAPYSFHGHLLEIDGKRFCIGVGRDISERKKTEREVLAAKERLDFALAGSSLALWDWDIANDTMYFNQGWGTLLGGMPIEARYHGQEVMNRVHPDDLERFRAGLVHAMHDENGNLNIEYRTATNQGDWIWIHTRGKVAERDGRGRACRMTGTSANVTKRKLAEERAEFLATRDSLTGLPNRMLLNDRLEQGIANAARKRVRLAFMFIDLDRFKTINDSLGHDVGDELLKRVAARLSACTRANDTVARLGGDEFAVILEDIGVADDDGAQNVAEKMIASLASPILINNQHLNTSCSIGIGLFPTDGTDAQSLMKHADVAMYDAKAKGRNNYQFFSHEMNARAQDRLSTENYLRLALRRDELVLHYQPRVSFATGRVTGVEALIRWVHPRRGLLLPDKFISVAEDSGLIIAIGEWVIETAFNQLAEWHKKGNPDLRVAVNLSPGQLFDGDRLIRAISTCAQAVSLDMRAVELELTESMLLKNIDETATLLNRLGELGVSLAIDDFGTGYSSLSYLKQLPVDSIKVDSSFVRDIGTDPNDEAIITAIIAMTHSLKLNVVAEGVETEDQYRVLRDLGCDEYQGYFFAKPLPPAEFEAQYLDAL